MADQGADVIKIEAPTQPDLTRGMGPAPRKDMGLAAMYVTCNRGKRSITLDLQSDEGVRIFKQLVRAADVVVQNYRPGVSEKLGVDYAAVAQVKPDIIYLSISGFGPTGPYADAKVYDQVIQAMSGATTVMSDANGQPTMFHNILADKVTALNAVQCVTAALLAKERGLGGQHIQLSMLDSAIHFLLPDAYWNKVWKDAKPIPEWRQIAQASEYKAADGKLTITAADRKQMQGLLQVAGLSHLVSDSVGKMRAEGLNAVRAKLLTMRSQDIFESCRRHGVPCGKFLNLEEVFTDPQVQHNACIQEHMHPDGGRYYTPRPPAQFISSPSAVQGPAPKMGADTVDVLKELGLTSAECDTLKAKKVI